MSDALRLVALNAGFVAVGSAVAILAGLPLSPRWVPTIAGVAPAAGLAACGIVASAGAMAGVDVGIRSTALLAVASLALAGFVLIRRRPEIGSLPSPAALRGAPELLGLTALGALSFSIVRLYAATGLDGWDGWAIWAPKAHALFAEGDVWGHVFTDSAYGMQHQEYPVLLPALEALSADAIGRYDPTLIDIEAAAILVAFGLGAWAILRLVVSAWFAAASAVALTGSTRLIDNGSLEYADSVVASFTALGLLCLFVWLSREAAATLVLAALFFTAAACTKAEGLVFAVSALLAALVSARGFGRTAGPVLRLAATVLVVPAGWAIVDRLNGPGADNIDTAALLYPPAMLDASGRIPATAWRVLEEVANGWPVVFIAVVLAVAATCLMRLWWYAAFPVLWAGLVYVALVGVYFANTAPIDWLLDTSADRVVFSLVYGLATVAPILAWTVWEHVRSDLRSTLRQRPEAQS